MSIIERGDGVMYVEGKSTKATLSAFPARAPLVHDRASDPRLAVNTPEAHAVFRLGVLPGVSPNSKVISGRSPGHVEYRRRRLNHRRSMVTCAGAGIPKPDTAICLRKGSEEVPSRG